MQESQLKRCLAFLEFFGIDYNGDTICVGRSDFLIISNPNSRWKEFLGYTIAEVAEMVARHLGKEIIFNSNNVTYVD